MAGSGVVGHLRTVLSLDAASYTGGIKKAKQDAASFSKGIESAGQATLRTSSQIERMAKGLRGDTLISTANAMAAAVTKIGGATKLTEAEQARLNVTITKAIEKYRALGQQAPAALQSLRKSLHPIPGQLSLMERGAASVKSSFGSMFAAFSLGTLATGAVFGLTRGLKNMATEAFQGANETVNLSNKLKISTETIQRWKFVTEQAGGSVESFARAAFQLSVRLGDGKSGVRGAVRDLGLDFDALKQQKPEDTFNNIIRALEAIKDPNERARLGVTLFGRTYQDMAGAVEEGMTRLMTLAPVTADAQVRALDNAGDAWARFARQVKTGVTGVLGSFVIAGQEFSKMGANEKIVLGLRSAMGLGVGNIPSALIARSIKRPQFGPQVATPPVIGRGGPDAIAQLADAEKRVKALTAAQREQLDAAITLGIVTDEYLESLDLTDVALSVYTSSSKDATKSATDFRKAQGEAATAAYERARQAQEWMLQAAALDARGLQLLNEASVEMMERLGKDALGLTSTVKMSDTAALSDYVNRFGSDITASATTGLDRGTNIEMSQAFALMGAQTRDELERTADAARDAYELMKASGQATAATLADAWEDMEAARRAAIGKTASAWEQHGLALLEGVQEIFGVLGQKYKAAAIAGAIIATYSAIAKSLAAAPFPWNLALAAGAAVAGFANVAKIKSAKAGFREGTPGLDFKNFGARSQVELHREEAVIPRGGGHRLAGEIAASLAGLMTNINPGAVQGGRSHSFTLGGFVPPGAVVPAVLHGGSRGELVAPLAKLAQMSGTVQRVVNQYITIEGMVSMETAEEFRRKILAPLEKRAYELNTDDQLGHLQRVIA